ncbi:MAG: cytochrome C [Cyclobacteriaceae bacterium]|nr:cytochrome C [Cyclobacteriaceae bacterium]MDH4296451.1 cytochrome C [Cyclobacteriaceae bacterium]MDH5249396.1 cytochrome C [Cyclobacteriaceae bacterium]
MRKTIQKFRHPVLTIISFLPGLLILALPYYRPVKVPFLLLFLGRLHPLVLHFPIVLIMLALLFEILRFYKTVAVGERVMLFLLIAAAVSTLTSVGAGFLLFASGDYSGSLIEQHFWAGAITASVVSTTVALYFMYRNSVRFYAFYLSGLFISNAAVAYASHLGGSVTHGQHYLTDHFQLIVSDLSSAEKKPESQMLVYEDMIAPILEWKCLSCHNAERSKGDLVMTSYQNLLGKGKSGQPALTPGFPDKSELFNRVVLPENHDDHMPPEGKTPLREDEQALLKYWIESGASEELPVNQARREDIGPMIEQLLPELVKYRRRVQVSRMRNIALQQELHAVAEKLSITITRDSLADGDYYAIAMKFPPAPFTNDQFKALSPFSDVFSKISLISSGIDDDGLYYIGQMKNLKTLYLQKTNLDGSGLVYLQKLSKLETLNLSFTKIDDKAALDLLKIPNLKQVYLYRTNTSAAVIEAIGKNRPGIIILQEEGPYF